MKISVMITLLVAAESLFAAVPEMKSPNFAGLSMGRTGSGTSWQPDSSPMEAVHGMANGWVLMLHWNAFFRYTSQDFTSVGSRGESEFGSVNWAMGSASKAVGERGQVAFRGMFSLDPITEGGNGYPLLFQTGETYKDSLLVDRQHPHDLISELSMTYSHGMGDQGGVFGYVGWPGEPALGPPAFMHRPSAIANPDSPLGHHWQDATHISFGVATIGLYTGTIKLDGSLFTGREPDERRYGLDRPRFDSYSGRVELAMAPDASVQVSRGFLNSPEAIEPDEDVWRTTASVLYNKQFGEEGNLAVTACWGMNESIPAEEDTVAAGGSLSSVLMEGQLNLGKQLFYTRLEWVEKTAHELALRQYDPEQIFPIKSMTVGTARRIAAVADMGISLGGHVSMFGSVKVLEPIYGKVPMAFSIYLRLAPTIGEEKKAGDAKHQMHGM